MTVVLDALNAIDLILTRKDNISIPLLPICRGTMRFSLLKAIKNTHRNPINRVLHAGGLTLYAAIIYIVLSNPEDVGQNLVNVLTLFILAVTLFLLGHRIEGNLRAMTWVILFKYLKWLWQKKKINGFKTCL
ncbi:MAG: hypothetical protein M3162_02345 [Thermoproteota archaeon]|nr:hypothetical protein [Thermoproteota archaeon]